MTGVLRSAVPGNAWDAIAADAPDSSFCHLSAWREVMTDVLGHEWISYVALGPEGTWDGILPLVRVKSRLFGHYLVSLPFLNGGGPVGTPEAVHALTEAAVAEARHSGADLLELRGRTPLGDGVRTTDRKITVELELPPTPEQLQKGFSSKLRSQIRRPLKENCEVRFGPGQVEPFYDVFSRNMRALGTPVLPARFFERIAALMPAQVVFGVVYHRDGPVAAGCGFLWRGEFEMTWASSLKSASRYAPNMLLYASFMEHVIAHGGHRFDFGRCTPGSGTHAFKRQWGGIDRPLPWGQWSPGAVTAPPSPDRPVFQLASAVWRRLPLVVTDHLGPTIARQLP